MEVSISPGNRKLGGIPSISLPPEEVCGTRACSKLCYARKMERIYTNVKKAWNRNFNILTNDHEEYFSQVRWYLSEKKPTYFRWHVGGDIPDQIYLNEMILIAMRYPSTKFLAYTKNFDLNFSRVPKNLSLVVSMWPGQPVPTDITLPKSWMDDGTDARIPENAHVCSTDCSSCKACWNLKQIGKDVVFHKH